MDPPRSLIRMASMGTTWLMVPDLKANQADEGQPSKEKPTQSSDHYDKK